MRQAFQWLALAGVFVGHSVAQAETHAVTLNLHGHHPMNAKTRYFEYRDGRIEKAPPDLFYFRPDEIIDGESQRQDKLAEILNDLDADFVALQEVVAGRPGEPLDCQAFSKSGGAESFGTNVAVRLSQNQAIKGQYEVALACRGNTGWVTGADIFRDRRIVTLTEQGAGQDPVRNVIWDFNEVPYPTGMVVEGFAILHRPSWRLIHNELRTLRVGPNSENFAYQVAAFRNEDGRTVMVANLHAGHKIRHFEQAVAVRLDLEFLRQEWVWPSNSPMMVMGDFNEPQQLPSGQLNWLVLPWQLKRDGYFDWSASREDRYPIASELRKSLEQLSRDRAYKPWADVANSTARIEQAISNLGALINETDLNCTDNLGNCAQKKPDRLVLKEVFATCHENCQYTERSSAEDLDGRIDFIFVPEDVPVLGFGLLGRDSWDNLNFVSDHPLVWARVGF